MRYLGLLLLLFTLTGFAEGERYFTIKSSNNKLTIHTTLLGQHHFESAGIRILSPNYQLAKPTWDCSMDQGGYCLFEVDAYHPQIIEISGPKGIVNISLCWDGLTPSFCQNYEINI